MLQPAISMRSWASLSSPMPHIAFWTLAEFLRPQTFSMGRFLDSLVCEKERAQCLIERARLLGQHDRNAVADRIGELGRTRDQFLLVHVVFERPLGQRADEDFEQLGIDTAGGTVGRCGGHAKAPLAQRIRGGSPPTCHVRAYGRKPLPAGSLQRGLAGGIAL